MIYVHIYRHIHIHTYIYKYIAVNHNTGINMLVNNITHVNKENESATYQSA